MSDKIYYDDQIADATLTALTEETSFEKEYIYENSPSNVWRTTSITAQTMLIDFGSAVLPLAFAWAGSNIESGDTLHTISAGTTTATSDYSESITKAGKGVHEINASWTARRYWKITATKATGTYIEYGKMSMLFGEYEFYKNYNWGYTTGLVDYYSESMGIYGQIQRQLRYTAKIFDISFNFLDSVQKVLFDETLRVEPYFFYYDDDNSVMWYGFGKFSTPIHTKGDYWNINLAFTEAK